MLVFFYYNIGRASARARGRCRYAYVYVEVTVAKKERFFRSEYF